MPLHSTEHIEKFQTYISSYVVNGFCNSLTEVMDIKGWVRSSYLNNTITTTTLEILFPGMVATYGAGVPVDIYFELEKLGGFRVFKGNQEMKGLMTLDLQFWIAKPEGYPEYAVGLTLTDTTFGFIAPVTDMTLDLQLTKINVDHVTVTHCAWGSLSAAKIKLEINNGYRVAEPVINYFLR